MHSQSAEKNADWGKLDGFKRLKTKGRELDIMLSSTNGGENHGIHSEVISALSLPRAVQNQIKNKKPNEDPKTIKLNLLDEEIAALVKFAYTGEVDDAFLEPLRRYGLNDLFVAWKNEKHCDEV